MTKTPIELKYNRTTKFLLPALRLNDQALISNGFKNAYIQDNEYDIRWDLEGAIFLLFKPENYEKFEIFCESARTLPYFLDEYDIDGGIVLVMEIPDKYKSIITKFNEGKYSEFDKKYVEECIPKHYNGKLSKKWKIFYKDKTLMEELANDLGYKNLEIAKDYINEVEDRPYAEDEILRYNKEIETNLTKRYDS